MTQAAEDVSLSKAHPGFDLGLVARLARTRREHPNPVMGRHHAVAAIDLRIVERGFVNCAVEIIGHRQPRHPAEETEHGDRSISPSATLALSRGLRGRAGSTPTP